MTALQHREDVAQGGAFWRRHNSDFPRQGRNGSLSLRPEQSFLLEFLLELLECELQRTEACRFEHLHDELVFPPSFVRTHAAARAKDFSVLRAESEQPRGVSKADGGKLRGFILQGEVNMSGRGCLEIGEFTLDPDVDETPLEHLANLETQLGNRIDLALEFGVSHRRSIVYRRYG